MWLTKATVSTLKSTPCKAEAPIFDEALPAFWLSVHAGGRKTWIFQLRVGTKARRLSLCTADKVDADRARKLAEDALSRAQPGEDPAEAKVEAAVARMVTLRSVLPPF